MVWAYVHARDRPGHVKTGATLVTPVRRQTNPWLARDTQRAERRAVQRAGLRQPLVGLELEQRASRRRTVLTIHRSCVVTLRVQRDCALRTVSFDPAGVDDLFNVLVRVGR